MHQRKNTSESCEKTPQFYKLKKESESEYGKSSKLSTKKSDYSQHKTTDKIFKMLKQSWEENGLLQVIRESMEATQDKFRYTSKRNTIKRMKIMEYDSIERNEENVGEALIEIRKIVKTINRLKDFGFSSKKITQWMVRFLKKKKPILRSLFINQSINKKSICNTYMYEHETSYQSIRTKLMKKYISLRNSKDFQANQEIRCLIFQLKTFRVYLEDILLNKNILKLNQLKKTMKNKLQSIKPCDWESVKDVIEPKCTHSSQVNHFIHDLNRFEYRYGQFNFLSKYDRLKFKEISDTENFILNEFKAINLRI